jgi:thiosulfate/3-mercaptopyruvate sulfurtransferase
MSGSTLVSTQALSRDLAGWRVFDCRHDLVKPELGESQYRESHIPGALFVHLDRDLSGPKTGSNGRHPLPDRGAFIAWLGQAGLQPGDRVVCYDAGNGAMAARLWWMLRWAGHEAVAVLDGGFAKWATENRPVTRDVPRFPQSRYPVRASLVAAVDVEDVEKAPPSTLLLDARAPARFRGEQEPIDPVAGHIPGANNRFNSENLAPEGTFKPPQALRDEFLRLLGNRQPAEVVHYCGSGVAACHNLLAMEVAGLTGGRLYAGSWSEWSADPKRRVAKGAA